MNYDISTKEGMANSVKWLEDMLASGDKPVTKWFIPRSLSIYTLVKADKTYTSEGVDAPTEKVLAAAGFTRKD